jgi:LPS sulfotransferase NodH
LLRAEQTGVWFESVQGAHEEPQQEPRFDFGEVRARVRLIGDHNAAWQEWFASTGVRPYPVIYEELAADPAGITSGVLDFLGLELPAGKEIVVRHRRLADHLNTRWIDRYRAGDLGS